MTKRDEILAAHANGDLLRALADPAAAVNYEDYATTVAELHNEGTINFLSMCCSDELDAFENSSAMRLYSVFGRALPQLQCTVKEASAACDKLFEKSEGDGAAGLFYDALQDWLKQDPLRVEEGLALVRAKTITRSGTAQAVLLAGAVYDREKFAEEAISLSREPEDGIRIDAIRSLGVIPLEADDKVLPLALNRLEEVIDPPCSDADAGFAAQAALRILKRIGEPVVGQVEPLLLKSFRNPSSATLRAVALHLRLDPKYSSEAVFDVAVKALQCVDAEDKQTIGFIDTALYRSDLSRNRTQLLELLKGLLGRKEGAIDIGELKNFRHKFRECTGDVQAWYIVSLLLTGNHGLGKAATRLMESASQASPEGFDIDLSPFSLEAAWIPYLARKILAYCRLNTVHLSRLLLSCLRAVPDQYRGEVEDLVFDYFLINFPAAIENLKTGLKKTDPAQASVKRLSDRMAAYLDAIKEVPDCEAFRPSERNRSLHFHQKEAMMEAAQKQAWSESQLFNLFPTVTMLYGSRVISYTYPVGAEKPVREERDLMRHTVQVDLPRMGQIDPVGYHYAITKFWFEKPPS